MMITVLAVYADGIVHTT